MQGTHHHKCKIRPVGLSGLCGVFDSRAIDCCLGVVGMAFYACWIGGRICSKHIVRTVVGGGKMVLRLLTTRMVHYLCIHSAINSISFIARDEGACLLIAR